MPSLNREHLRHLRPEVSTFGELLSTLPSQEIAP